MNTPHMPDVEAADHSPAEYRVAVFSKPGDMHLIAEILCDTLHLHPTDAAIQAHYAPGVLPQVMTEIQAQEAVRRIVGLGVQAAVVRAAELPDMSQAITVHHARFQPNGWEIVDYRGDVAEIIPWSQLEIIAIGDVPLPDVQRFTEVRQAVVTTAPQPLIGRLKTHDSFGPELWIIRSEPFSVYYIEHRAMNYECLGERMTDSAAANFRVYADELVQHATSAWQTPSTRAYLKKDLHTHYEFPDSEHLQRHAILSWVMKHAAQSA